MTKVNPAVTPISPAFPSSVTGTNGKTYAIERIKGANNSTPQTSTLPELPKSAQQKQ